MVFTSRSNSPRLASAASYAQATMTPSGATRLDDAAAFQVPSDSSGIIVGQSSLHLGTTGNGLCSTDVRTDRGSPYSARSSRDRRRAIRTTRLVDYSEALLEDLSRRSADETPYIAPQRTDRDRKLRRCDSADPLDHEIDLLSKLK